MHFEIAQSGGFSTLEVKFKEGEILYAQPKSMLCMTTGFTITAHIGGAGGVGSITQGVKSLLSGESFSTVKYVAKRSNEALTLAPSAVGEIMFLELAGSQGFYLARGAYLAHEVGVTVQPKFGGLKSVISKKGLFLLHASGAGRVAVASFGAICRRELAAGEMLVVDNEYVIAFEETLTYELRSAAPGIIDSLMSGEGLVNRYTGPGVIYYQTRSRQKQSLLSGMLGVMS